MIATNLKVNRLANTAGVSSGSVTFSWIPTGVQTGFIISIKAKGSQIYTSGIVKSTDYSYSPDVSIPSRSYVEWSISLIDESGKVGEEVFSTFITVPDKNEWSAKWIDPELIHPTYCRRADEGFAAEQGKLS